MAEGGASAKDIKTVVEGAGYNLLPQTYSTGNPLLRLFGGGTDVPVVGAPRGARSTAAAPTPEGSAGGGETMRIKNTKTGRTAVGPKGKIPNGWELVE